MQFYAMYFQMDDIFRVRGLIIPDQFASDPDQLSTDDSCTMKDSSCEALPGLLKEFSDEDDQNREFRVLSWIHVSL